MLTLLLALNACTLVPFDATNYDADGDGLDWDVDCDDSDPAINEARVWFPDSDGDGLGDGNRASDPRCVPPQTGEIWLENDRDCNDSEPDVGMRIWYRDSDSDSYGEEERAQESCTRPDGFTATPGDCDDTDASAHPDAPEFCSDLEDNDCDGTVDEDMAIDAPTWYLDSDGDKYGDPTTAVDACTAPGDDYINRTGDCVDTNAEINPGVEEICGNVLDDNCDDANEPSCGLTPGVVEEPEAWLIGSDGTQLGWSVALVPSVSEDDQSPDLILGAYNASTIHLVHGPISGDIFIEDNSLDILTITSPSAGELVGWSLAQPVDMTGDGSPDLIFGGPGHQSNRGAAFLLPGPHATGTLSTDDAIAVVGEAEGDFAGYAVATTNSGTLLVGAPFTGTFNNGAAYVISGPLLGSELDIMDQGIKLRGESSGDQAGSAVASARDVNGDGSMDLLIGAPYFESEGLDARGAVYLVLGPFLSDLSLADADLTLLGEGASDQAGLKLAPGGHIYQFQADTVLIGAPTAQNLDGEASGRAYILSHQTLLDHLGTEPVSLSNADTLFIGADLDDEAGTIAHAGDLDGDGRDDVALGAPGTAQGQLHVWYGGFSLLGTYETSDADVILLGERSGDAFGFAVSGGQDIDDDGYGDLFVGAWGYDGLDSNAPDAGAAYLLRGGPGP